MARTLQVTIVAIGLAVFGGVAMKSAAHPERPEQAEQPPAANLNQEFASLAAEKIPGGFGGWFFDDEGVLHVYLKDTRVRGAAIAALQSHLAGRTFSLRGRGLDIANMRVLEGQYDFVELNGWFDRLDSLFQVEGVVFTDIDEMKNRLVVGVLDDSVRRAAQATLADTGVPPEAVLFEVTPPMRPSADSLTGYVRPVTGGLQIASRKLCSLGFNALRGGVSGFITASHCTDVINGLDSTAKYQPQVTNSTWYIGSEAADPNRYTGGDCPANYECRWADAAFFRYAAGVSTDFGTIARTTGSSRTSGSKIIDPVEGRFRIIGRVWYPSAGEVLDKMGRITGWTYGNVSKTCGNWNPEGTNTLYKCQDYVDAGVATGDSGAPVFGLSGDLAVKDVYLYGILAGQTSSTNFIFSALWNIENDLGAITVN
jgi:hypothetical protein